MSVFGRLSVRISALLGAVLIASCASQTALIDPSDSWLMYQRTPDHNTVITRSALSAGWSFDAGGQINGSMALTGKVLFVDTLVGDLLAVDVEKQNVLWRVHLPHSLMTTPLIYKGLVIVGSGTPQIPANLAQQWGRRKVVMGVADGDGIYAYDASSGRLRWSFRTAGEDMPSPAIYRGTLIFANGDFHAYGLDATTGRLIWKSNLSGLATMSSAAIGGKRAFFSTCDYRFPYRCQTVALDPVDGKILWHAPFGDADCSPTYANGTVFVSGLDYADGSKSWPFVQQAYAVVAALDASTGRPKWAYHDGSPELPSNVGTSERAVAGTYSGGKYFQSRPGSSELFAFDARSGSILWRFRTIAPIKMSPLYYRNRVYAGGNAGILYVLDASDGKLTHLRTFRRPFTAAPPLIAGDVLLLAQNRSVVALSLDELSQSATLAPTVKDKVQRWTQ